MYSQRQYRPNYSEDENVALSDVFIYRVSPTYSINIKRHCGMRWRLFVYEEEVVDMHCGGKMDYYALQNMQLRFLQQ